MSHLLQTLVIQPYTQLLPSYLPVAGGLCLKDASFPVCHAFQPSAPHIPPRPTHPWLHQHRTFKPRKREEMSASQVLPLAGS